MTLRWMTAFLDFPEETYDAGAGFWSAVTGYERSPQRGSHGQFATLVPPDGRDYLRLQRLTPGPDQPLLLLDDEQAAVTAHLDWSSTDREAEIQQHVAGGAELQKSFAGWTVLRDPAGMTYCITGRTAGDRPE
jgi:hypothetical protein